MQILAKYVSILPSTTPQLWAGIVVTGLVGEPRNSG
jgi:hypothetical protein